MYKLFICEHTITLSLIPKRDTLSTFKDATFATQFIGIR